MPSFSDVYAAVKLDLDSSEEQRLKRRLEKIDTSTAGRRMGVGMSKSLGQGFRVGIGGAARTMFAPIAAAAAAVGGFQLFKGFIEDAQESAKISRITAQVIESTGGAAKITATQVDDLAQALSNKTAVDDELVQTGANLLLTFKNVRNEVGEGNDIFNQATEAALDLSAAGFGSVESASKMLGKALNDPIAGLTALGRAGVTFTDQQKENIRVLVESGDILGAQLIIMEEVQSQVGGAAEAAAGPLDRLKTIVGNIGEQVGTVLLPYLEDFAEWIVREGVPRVESMIATFRDKWIPVIKDAIEIGKDWKEEIGILIGAILGIRAAILVVQAFMLTNPLGVFILAVGTLIALFIRLDQVTNDWRVSLRILSLATDHIPGIGALLDVLTNIRGVLVGIKKLWDTLRDTFREGWSIPGFGSFLFSGGAGGKQGGRLSAADLLAGHAFPLPRGSYRWGRGPAAHGYDAQDLPVPTGTPVFAPTSGFARGIDLGNRSYGKYIQIASSRFGRVILAHLSKLFVGTGFVRAGQVVGLSGSTGNSTGPHLHVEPSRILSFDTGGWLPRGLSLAYNGTGAPERILGPNEPMQVNIQLPDVYARVPTLISALRQMVDFEVDEALRMQEMAVRRGGRA